MNITTIEATTFPQMLAAIFQCLNDCPVFETDSINKKLFEIEITSLGRIDVTAIDNDTTEADLVSETIPSMDELKTCLDAMAKVGATYIIQFNVGGKNQTLQFERK